MSTSIASFATNVVAITTFRMYVHTTSPTIKNQTLRHSQNLHIRVIFLFHSPSLLPPWPPFCLPLSLPLFWLTFPLNFTTKPTFYLRATIWYDEEVLFTRSTFSKRGRTWLSFFPPREHGPSESASNHNPPDVYLFPVTNPLSHLSQVIPLVSVNSSVHKPRT